MLLFEMLYIYILIKLGVEKEMRLFWIRFII